MEYAQKQQNKRQLTMPKILGIVVIAILLCTVLAIVFGVFEFFVPDTMEYAVNSDRRTCTVTGAKNSETLFLRIPEEINGYTVTQIAANAFNKNEMIIAILPETIEKIGEGAFAYCENLLWVSGIEKCKSLKVIENDTFSRCSDLHKIKLPGSIERIESSAFMGCAFLLEITIPPQVTMIEHDAFVGCVNIKTLNLPASLQYMDSRVVNGCYSLENIIVDEQNLFWRSMDGVVYSKDMTTIHAYPAGKTERVFSIPEGVTTISSYTFAFNRNLETLNIPSSVVQIGKSFLEDFIPHESKLQTINYDGTIEMWNSIVKSENWDIDALDFTIYCIDGTITKDGTVTYK